MMLLDYAKQIATIDLKSEVPPQKTAVEANLDANATRRGKETARHVQDSFSVGEMADEAPAPKRRRTDSLGSWVGTGATAPTDTAPPNLTDVCNGIDSLSNRGAGELNRAAKPSGNAANASESLNNLGIKMIIELGKRGAGEYKCLYGTSCKY